MSIKNFKLTIQYDGTGYSGWQIQKEQRTVQGTLKQSVENIIHNNNVNIIGSGRTDSGVHSLGQVMNMKIETNMNETEMLKSMNANLPYDIKVVKSEIVDGSFNARFSAKKREYVYQVINKATPFNYKYYWQYPYTYDLGILNKCADIVLNQSDFSGFCKHSPDINNYNCDIYKSLWIQDNDGLKYNISANRFLHHMVRMLVGTMLEVSRGKLLVDDFIELFNINDNKRNILTAPSKGLYLSKVFYAD